MWTGSGIRAQGPGWSMSSSRTASARRRKRSRSAWAAARFPSCRWSEKWRHCLNPDWQTVDAETVSRLQAIIRFDTTNPPGNELPLALYLEAALHAEGIETP